MSLSFHWNRHKPGLWRIWPRFRGIGAQQGKRGRRFFVEFEYVDSRGHVTYVGHIVGPRRNNIRTVAEKMVPVLAKLVVIRKPGAS